jgi:hypothetical protein
MLNGMAIKLNVIRVSKMKTMNFVVLVEQQDLWADI